MSWKWTELPYLARKAPEELRATITRTFRDEDAHMIHTAERLGLSREMLYRYIRDLGIMEDIQRVRDEVKDQHRIRARTRRTVAYKASTPAAGWFHDLVRTNAPEARLLLMDAFQDARGLDRVAASNLGIRRDVFHRYVRTLGLEEKLVAVREQLKAARADGVLPLLASSVSVEEPAR